MAEINIDLKSLGDKAVQIRKINSEIKDEFDKICNEINTTGDIWKSKTAVTLSENYNNLNTKVQDFYKDLNAYADFLTTTAEAYGYVEKEIKKNAESFID